MGLEQLKQEILKKAEEKAEQIIKEAKEQEKAAVKQAEKRVGEYSKSSEEEIAKLSDMIEKRAKAASELESRKMLLSAKGDITQEVFLRVSKEIAHFDSRKREVHIQKLIERARGRMEIGRIYCNRKDMKFVKGFEAAEAEIKGGIIAESKDRSVRIDESYDSILEGIRDRNLQEISKIIFQ